MRTRSAVPLFLAGAVLAGVDAGAADVLKAVRRKSAPLPRDAHRDGEVIVAFRDSATEREMDRALREGAAGEVRRSRSSRRMLVTLQPGMTVAEAVRRYSAMPEVQYAEPNGLVRKTQAQTFRPDDRFFRFQWNMAQLDAERTWAIQKGQPGVAVAVLDSGVAYEDYTDPRTGQTFRKAPDWGGTRFLPGYDFVNDDAHPNDDEYHGTHVASTIAEATNNGLGVAGLAFNCSIMPVKVLDENGEGTFFDLAEGIDFAVNYSEGGQKPVKVINMSLGADSFSQAVRSAAERAYAAGVTLVAASGNSGRGVVDFPASLQVVLAVGATDARRERASYSNWGPELDFLAPGGDCDRDDDTDGEADCVFQQMPDPDLVDQGRHDEFCYCGIDGTSMASPHVAAVAALLYSQGFTDPQSVRAALEQTAERLGGAPAAGRNDTHGHGLVRPAQALPGQGLDVGPAH
jgi:serine protease